MYSKFSGLANNGDESEMRIKTDKAMTFPRQNRKVVTKVLDQYLNFQGVAPVRSCCMFPNFNIVEAHTCPLLMRNWCTNYYLLDNAEGIYNCCRTVNSALYNYSNRCTCPALSADANADTASSLEAYLLYTDKLTPFT